MEIYSAESTSYFKIFILLFSNPNASYKLILEKDETLPQYIVLGLYGVLNAITPILISQPIVGETIFLLIYSGAMGAVVGWFIIWLLSHLINITNNLLKVETDFDDVFFIFTYSFCPLIVSRFFVIILKLFFPTSQLVSILIGLLALVGYIWTIVLLFIGNKFLSKASWLKNTIAIIIPVAILVILNIVLANLQL
jgi:hypothetical protein